MLTISRKLGEKVLIGDNVWVTIVDIGDRKVRLGIEAPRSIPIYRQEVLPEDHPAAKEVRRERG